MAHARRPGFRAWPAARSGNGWPTIISGLTGTRASVLRHDHDIRDGAFRGRGFYSPRVYEYAAAIAPKGQEASYGALSYMPFLVGKLLVGTFSAALLAKYCPAVGERHSGTMWLFVALTATIAPLGCWRCGAGFACRKPDGFASG